MGEIITNSDIPEPKAEQQPEPVIELRKEHIEDDTSENEETTENVESNNEINQDQEGDQNEEDEEPQEEELEEIDESQKSLEKALEYKEKGNTFFKDQNIDDAIECYEFALKYCPSSEIKHLSVFNSNLAICFLKKEDYDTVIEYATSSIKLDPSFKKPLQNRATAYEKKEQLEDALEDLKELEKLEPTNNQWKAKIFVMTKDLEKLNEKRKDEVFSGLKSLGNTLLGKIGLSLDNFKLQQNDNGSYNIQFSK